MDGSLKLLLILLFCSLIAYALEAKKISAGNYEEPIARRRWEDDILDEADVKPREKMTRINVNFRRAGKKPRIRVHGPPMKMPSPGVVPTKYISNPFLSGYNPDSPFLPYMPTIPGAHPAFSPEYAAVTGRKEWPHITPMKKSIAAQSFSRSPQFYLPVSQQQLLLAQLLTASLKENNIKPSDLLLANYRAALEDSGVIPSPMKTNPYKSMESTKLHHYLESKKPTHHQHKDYVISSSPEESFQYTSPNYPSPYTYQEVPKYRDYPSAHYERDTEVESPYEYLASNQRNYYTASYPSDESDAQHQFHYEGSEFDYPMDMSVRRKNQSSLSNHKIE